MRNRNPEKCKFLNVLSGADEYQSDQWYEAVKHFSDPAFVKEAYGDEARTLEGYAFAGINMRNMRCVLKRLLKLREDGLLENKGWIHFLGTGRLQWACHLTSIQRMLRKHDSPNITLSFDAASPFVNTAYGQTYAYNIFENKGKRFGYFMDRAFDNQMFKESKLPAPFAKTLGDSNIAVLPPFQLIPSPLPGSLNCNALTPSILLLLSLKTVATEVLVNRRELVVPLIVNLVKAAESAVSLPLNVAES